MKYRLALLIFAGLLATEAFGAGKGPEVRVVDEGEKPMWLTLEEAAQKERERIEQEQLMAETKKKQEEARKAEELAQASDKEKWADLISQIENLSLPEMRSGQYRKKMQTVKEYFEEIKNL